MRPLPKYLALVCSTALLFAGCGGSDATSSSNTNASPPAMAGAAETGPTTVPSVTPTSADTTPTTTPGATPTSLVTAVAIPTTDPCDMLTAAAASNALGMPVGDKITQPGEGNTTCAYRPADPAAQGLVSLTLYGVTATEASFDTLAQQGPDDEVVDGVGEAALLSLQGQSIAVLTGSTVFAIGMFPQQADGSLLPVTKDQLIAVARAVLEGR